MERQGGEGYEPGDGHGRPQHVDQLYCRYLCIQQFSIQVPVKGDDVSRTSLGDLELVGAHPLYDVSNPSLRSRAE